MPYGEGNPQLEDGYAAIANEILESLARTDLTSIEFRCIFYLWRKTYGWTDKKGQAKKSDAISYSQWAAGTGVDKSYIIKTLNHLVERKILVKTTFARPGKNPATIWSFQKKYQEWNGYHEAEVVEFQTLLSLKPVYESPPVPVQVVDESPPVSFEVVKKIDKVVDSSPLEVVDASTPTISNISNTTISTPPSKGPDPGKKQHWGAGDNVLLLKEEYDKLVEKFGEEGAAQRIDNLSTYQGIKKYKDHYLTILRWDIKDKKDQKTFGHKPPPGKVSSAKDLEDWGHSNDD